MKCKIEINMDNAAFQNEPSEELANILQKLTTKIRYDILINTDTKESVRDINGNTVGFFKIVK